MDHEIKVTVTYKHYAVIDSVRLVKYPKYDVVLFDMAEDTGQNYWTRKYRSQ